ncbi:MAG: NTP transferase domain-containing protein, partial [Myxococcales bacterium]|nr:NTP transferase domain-containing protein [Myxococcales bacterium]
MKRAILLAAGRGRRLQRDEPKCLTVIAGKTLLERHVENLTEAGIESLTIVVGYKQELIREFLQAKQFKLPIELIENARFVHGSIVSLQVAGELLERGAIWMDADVLYPASLMKKLVESKHENCVLLDRRSEESGEEMMLGYRDGHIQMIARRVSPSGPWDVS